MSVQTIDVYQKTETHYRPISLPNILGTGNQSQLDWWLKQACFKFARKVVGVVAGVGVMYIYQGWWSMSRLVGHLSALMTLLMYIFFLCLLVVYRLADKLCVASIL